jgi:hypothetical protein
MPCADIVHKHEMFEIHMPAARRRVAVALQAANRCDTVCMLD